MLNINSLGGKRMHGIISKRLSISLILTFVILLTACNSSELRASTLDEEHIKGHIEALASDELQGRMIGSEGNRRAMDYIEAHFKAIGLAPADNGEYRQAFNTVIPVLDSPVVFRVYGPDGTLVRDYKQGQDFTIAVDNYSMGGSFKGSLYEVTSQAELVQTDDRFKGLGVILDYNDIGLRTNGYTEFKIDDRLYMEKAEVIIYKNEGNLEKQSYDIGSKDEWMPERGLIKLGVSPVAFAELQGFSNNGYEIEVISELNFSQADTFNLLGVIPGKSRLYEEYIMIAASFDGLGMDFNGEIKAASSQKALSTALLLEIADYFKRENISTNATIIFAAFNGGEIGYKGVKNYLIKPMYPQERTKVIFLEDLLAGDNPLEIFTYEAGRSRRRSQQLLLQMAEIAEGKGLQHSTDIGYYKGEYALFRGKGMLALRLGNPEQQSYTEDNTYEGMLKTGEAIIGYVHQYGSSSIMPELKSAIRDLWWLAGAMILLMLGKRLLQRPDMIVKKDRIKKLSDMPIISYGLLFFVLSFLLWLQTWFAAVEASGLPAGSVSISLEGLFRMLFTSIFTSSVMLFWISVYMVPIIIVVTVLASPRFKLSDFLYLVITAVVTAITFTYPLSQYYTESLNVLLPRVLAFNNSPFFITFMAAAIALLITELWRRERQEAAKIRTSKIALVTAYLLVFSLVLIMGLAPFLFSEEIINLRAGGNVVRF